MATTLHPPDTAEADLDPANEGPAVAALSVTGLSKRFGESPIVDGLSLDVRPGELVALLGPSGCGKTTTLRLIAGFEEPDAGRIHVAGVTVAGDGRSVPPERRRVGMIFQEYALFPHLTVGGNVAFGLRRDPGRDRRVAAMLDLVGLTGTIDRLPAELSGGQQQRVAVARALAPEPAVVLLDEPFSNLDQTLRVQLRGEVRRILREAGATAVLVTHDQDEAFSMADRVAVMLGGQLRQVGTPEAVYRAPADREVAAFVGDARFLPGWADGDRIETPLGSLPAATAAHGDVDVLLRPEMLRIDADGSGTGTPAVVSLRHFSGRDCTVGLLIADGGSLLARCSSWEPIAVGNRVSVSVRGPVVCFPRP